MLIAPCGFSPLADPEGEGFVAALLEAPQVAVALLRQFATRLRATDRLPALPAIRPRPPAPPGGAVTASVTSPRGLDPGVEGFFEDPYAHLTPLREQGRCTGPSPSAPGW